MTQERKIEAQPARAASPSTSGDLGLELLGLRVNGAQLGTMLGVSRQAVSRAAQRGTISRAAADGRFDAKRAVREWMENSDPCRVRARILKPGAEMVGELRERMQALTAEVDRLRTELEIETEWSNARERAATVRAEDAAARSLARYMDALANRFAEASSAHAVGSLARWLDELAAVEFYGQDLAEYRADAAEDEAGGDEVDAA